MYIISALENIALKPHEPESPFAGHSFGVVVDASCNKSLDLTGQVFCKRKVSEPVC